MSATTFSATRRWIVLLVFAALIIACRSVAPLPATPPPSSTALAAAPTEPSSGGSTPTVTSPTVTSPVTPSPAPTAVSTEPGEVEVAHPLLVVYHKTGCFAGVDQTLFVYRDGRYDLQDRQGLVQSGQLPPADLAQLHGQLSSPEFAALQPLYQAAGADLCIYQLTVPDGQGQPHTVTTMDAAPTPPFLAALIRQLETLPGKYP